MLHNAGDQSISFLTRARMLGLVQRSLNHSVAQFDPTSHGEIEAIRDACRKLETVDLSGCVMYTTCEP